MCRIERIRSLPCAASSLSRHMHHQENISIFSEFMCVFICVSMVLSAQGQCVWVEMFKGEIKSQKKYISSVHCVCNFLWVFNLASTRLSIFTASCISRLLIAHAGSLYILTCDIKLLFFLFLQVLEDEGTMNDLGNNRQHLKIWRVSRLI